MVENEELKISFVVRTATLDTLGRVEEKALMMVETAESDQELDEIQKDTTKLPKIILEDMMQVDKEYSQAILN